MSGQDTLSSFIFSVSDLPIDDTAADAGLQMLDRTGIIPPGWLFIYLFFLIALLAWIRLNYGNMLLQTIQASTNFQVANRMFKDNSLLQKQIDNILYGYYFISASFLLYLAQRWMGWAPYGLEGGFLLLFNLALLAAIFFGRIVLVNVSGFLFNRLRIFREYLYNTFIYSKLIGIGMVPLMLFLVYTRGVINEVFHWTAFGLVGVVILSRVLRGLVFSFKKGVLIFYMFLYLCALELAPLAILYRWLKGVL